MVHGSQQPFFSNSLLFPKVVTGKVMVGVTIHSYSNPNGTAYVESTTSRKCCDGPQRFSCETGDTCDTYFDICIGR